MDFIRPHKQRILVAIGVCAIVISWLGPTLEAGTQGQKRGDSESQLFRSAVTDCESGRFQDAERQLVPLLKRSPQAFDVNELMGLVLAAEHRDAEASGYLASAVRANPGSVAARGAHAACLVRLGRMVEAEAEFKKAVALKPSDYDANHNLGELYIRTGKIGLSASLLGKRPGDPAFLLR